MCISFFADDGYQFSSFVFFAFMHPSIGTLYPTPQASYGFNVVTKSNLHPEIPPIVNLELNLERFKFPMR
jgi:hypothetical protein